MAQAPSMPTKKKRKPCHCGPHGRQGEHALSNRASGKGLGKVKGQGRGAQARRAPPCHHVSPRTSVVWYSHARW